MISILSCKLQENGIEFKNAVDDADTLIAATAINKSLDGGNIVIIGEDIDLLVLLTALAPIQQDILFVKPSHGKTETRIYSSKDSQKLGLKNNILFIHAFSGCDTVSAAFRKGKLNFHRFFKKQAHLQNIADVFNSLTSSPEEVAKAENECFLKWYRALITEKSLNLQRYHSFTKLVRKMKPDISVLPPTEGAARQHSFRDCHQVQQWLGKCLPPELWGWQRKVNGLLPLTT